MGLGEQGNLLYVTDLGLATEHRPAQVNATTGRSMHASLIGTARFASVNGHLGVGKCNTPCYYHSKTDKCPSATSLRRFGISWVHASLLPTGLSPVARSQGHESRPKGGAYLGEEESNRCGRSVRGSALGIRGLFQLHPFCWIRRRA